MNRPAGVVLSFAIAISSANLAGGQVASGAAPDRPATAQNEAWYLNGDPVSFAGNLYYPAGPRTYFNRYEMIRSGFMQGVPLYTRTTIEPFSIVYVPIGGGLMQPYERRRAGDLAGTVGSTTPSFPVTRPSEEGNETTAMPVEPPMAAAPPIQASAVESIAVSRVVPPRPAPAVRTTVGTSGDATVLPSPFTRSRPRPRPDALNSVFVPFEGQRWFSSGATVLFNRNRFARIGTYHGLPVYRRDDHRTIYIPVQANADLLAQYSKRNPRNRNREAVEPGTREPGTREPGTREPENPRTREP